WLYLSTPPWCGGGCGVFVPARLGRRTRYELADVRIRHALDDLLGLVLAVDPTACPDAADKDCC
ncbi:transcriptional regulator, partial [Actinoplanes sp. NPDC051411]